MADLKVVRCREPKRLLLYSASGLPYYSSYVCVLPEDHDGPHSAPNHPHHDVEWE